MNISILEKLARRAMGGEDITSVSIAMLKGGRITEEEHQALTSLRGVAMGTALAVSARQSGATDGVLASKEWTDGWWC